MRRVLASRDEEVEIHKSLHPELERVVSQKRFCVFQSVLQDLGYVDVKVVDELKQGLQLTGWLPESGVFAPLVSPPQMHVLELDEQAEWSRGALLSSMRPADDASLDQSVRCATEEEVSKGWAVGPIDPSSLDPKSIISRRFGIVQKGKTRTIDDLSASSINSTVGSMEKIFVEGIDSILAAIVQAMKTFGPGRQLLGKCYDLKAAYKQVPLRQSEWNRAHIAVWSPHHGAPKIFGLRAVPVGALSAVHGFLRLAESLKFILRSHMRIICTSYFDDYVVVCEEGTEHMVDRTVLSTFNALGWEINKEERKFRPFSKIFAALGVQFDLSNCCNSVVQVCNTNERKEELFATLTNVLDKNLLHSHEAQVLRSRLLFAEAQIYGRTAKRALSVIAERGLQAGCQPQLDDSLRVCVRGGL